ncbi:unnamed protein product [Albugo candida]|uniref:Uncharacterized protein n=1 Tax=Albugo candida TaxID=65357 RepID=A0A024FTJ9_9STRA|nr:unnamed protein product [Albugo candida]|eukprot:CCI10356.1 unnamed protein product [Albugo candida]
MNRSAITRLFAIAPLNSSNGTCINISVSARSINSSTARVRSTSKSCLPTFIYVQPQEASPVSSLSETRSTFRTLLASSSIDTGVPECFAKLFCCSYASWCSPTSRRLQTCAPSGETAVLGQHSRFITHPILLNRFELVDAIENRIKGRTQILIVLKNRFPTDALSPLNRVQGSQEADVLLNTLTNADVIELKLSLQSMQNLRKASTCFQTTKFTIIRQERLHLTSINVVILSIHRN